MNQICQIQGNREDEDALVLFLKDVYGWDAKMETVKGKRVLMCDQEEGTVLPIINSLMGLVNTIKDSKNA